MIIERRGVVVRLDGAKAATDDEATADENTTSVVIAAERLRVIVDLTSLPGQTRCSKLSCLRLWVYLLGRRCVMRRHALFRPFLKVLNS